jgi:uncharacterized protein YbjT (DUF2867 family)
LHRLEERLNVIAGVNVINLRAAYFMENTLAQVGIIQQTGMVAGPLNPELKLPMIASRDIGAYAAQVLLRPDFSGHQTLELLGQRDLTMLEVTAILGKAIGKPDLTYHQVSYEQFHGTLTQMGISRSIADAYVEMTQAQNSGHVRALEARSARNTTPTSYEQFVAEVFLRAFQGKSAAA